MSQPQKYPNYINGGWVESAKTFENRNPANTDEIVGVFSKGSAADVTQAADAAARSFRRPGRRRMRRRAPSTCSKSPTFSRAASAIWPAK